LGYEQTGMFSPMAISGAVGLGGSRSLEQSPRAQAGEQRSSRHAERRLRRKEEWLGMKVHRISAVLTALLFSIFGSAGAALAQGNDVGVAHPWQLGLQESASPVKE
jgi:hypothetical protein